MRFFCGKEVTFLSKNMLICQNQKEVVLYKESTSNYNEPCCHLLLLLSLFIKNKLTLCVISALCDIYDISGLVVILVPLKRHLAPHRINSEFHRNLIKKLTLINNVNISTVSRQSLFQRYNLVKNDEK